MAAVTPAAGVEVATWAVVAVASTAVVAASVADTTAALEVTAVGIMVAAMEVARTAGVVPLDAVTGAHMAPVAQLPPGRGRGKVIVPAPAILLRDGMGLRELTEQAGPGRPLPPGGRVVLLLAGLPETTHLMQRPQMEIGTPLARLAARL